MHFKNKLKPGLHVIQNVV